jgi:hypothetical protein
MVSHKPLTSRYCRLRSLCSIIDDNHKFTPRITRVNIVMVLTNNRKTMRLDSHYSPPKFWDLKELLLPPE